MDRRRFLKSNAAMMLMAPFGLWLPNRGVAHSHVTPWGELPSGDDYWPPGRARPGFKILEIHLSGGLSPYETFFVNRTFSSDERWFGFAPKVREINWSGCVGPLPLSPDQVESLSSTSVIGLGPATAPIWGFKDDLRMLVLAHSFLPHEAAIPLSITGLQLGNPRLAGLGAAVEHRYDRALSGKELPNSYVLIPPDLGIDDDSFRGLFATGIHGSRFTPLTLRLPSLGRDEAFLDALQRTGRPPVNDELLATLTGQYRDRMRHSAAVATPARSGEFTAYDVSLRDLFNGPALSMLLDEVLVGTDPSDFCITPSIAGTGFNNATGAALKTAARLLSRDPDIDGARYVGLIDQGIASSTGGGYDVHNLSQYHHMHVSLWNCLNELRQVIYRRPPGAPAIPDMIDLNETVILFNTEFGRAGPPSPTREHWPFAYVNVVMGGPVAAGYSGGEIGLNGLPTSRLPFSPADLHAGMLMTAGIDPFVNENYGVGDVSAGIRAVFGPSEAETAHAIRIAMLGVR